MEITQQQYEKIEKYLPRQHENVSMSNLQLINAILYVTKNGYKWRALPKKYGNWHTIYVRMYRWSKNGVLQRVFEALELEGIIPIRVEAVCLDSTSVKVHPDGTGTLKKVVHNQSDAPEEDLPRKFIWSPHLIDRLSTFACPEEKNTTHRKEQHYSKRQTEAKKQFISSRTEPMKEMQYVKLLSEYGTYPLYHRKRIAKTHGSITKSCTSSITKLSVSFCA